MTALVPANCAEVRAPQVLHSLAAHDPTANVKSVMELRDRALFEGFRHTEFWTESAGSGRVGSVESDGVRSAA